MISERAFLTTSMLLFAMSAAVTVVWCGSMSAMGGMPMPGGWTMSMTWMRMPGQSWPGAAATFLGMWIVMMVAMMLPSLMPMLSRYRRAHAGGLTWVVALGYFFVWTLFGMLAFPLGVALATVEMRQPLLARAVPAATAVIVLMIGAVQFTAWKAHRLVCCRATYVVANGAGAAWRHGVRLGINCGLCCLNLMLLPLILGVMDLRVMAVVTAAITVERLAPHGARAARVTGAIILAAGLLLLVALR